MDFDPSINGLDAGYIARLREASKQRIARWNAQLPPGSFTQMRPDPNGVMDVVTEAFDQQAEGLGKRPRLSAPSLRSFAGLRF